MSTLVGGMRGRSPAAATPARRAGGFPGPGGGDGDPESPSDDDEISQMSGEDEISMQIDAHLTTINVQQNTHMDVTVDNRVLLQQNTVNVQQNYGVDGAALMESVTAFVDQSEAMTRDRINEASRSTAAIVMSEAENRHAQATGVVHEHYTNVFQQLHAQYQAKVEEVRAAAQNEASQSARRTAEEWQKSLKDHETKFKAEAEVAAKAIRDYDEKVKMLQSQVQSDSQKLSSASQELVSLRNERIQQKKELTKVATEKQEVQNTLDQVRASTNHLLEDIKLKQKVKEKELKEARRQLTGLAATPSPQQLTSLEAELSTVREQHEDTLVELNKVRAKLTDAEGRKTSASSDDDWKGKYEELLKSQSSSSSSVKNEWKVKYDALVAKLRDGMPQHSAAPPCPQEEECKKEIKELKEKIDRLEKANKSLKEKVKYYEDWEASGDYEDDMPPAASAAAAEQAPAAMPVDPLGQQACGSGSAIAAEPARPRAREADRIILPQYPSASTLRAWKTEVYARAQAASARSDHKTTIWLKEAEDDHIPANRLARVPEELFTLDSKLQAALLAICKGDFGVFLVQMNANSYRDYGKPLTSTQILREIYMDCKTTSSLRTYHGILDLSRVEWLGDGYHDLRKYRNNLDEVMADIGDSMDDHAKQEYLLHVFDGSALFRFEAQLFRRLPVGDPERTYSHLHRALDREIERGREHENRAQKLEVFKKHNEENKKHKYQYPGAYNAAEDPYSDEYAFAAAGTGKGKGKKGPPKKDNLEPLWIWGMETEEEHAALNKIHDKQRPCLSFHATGECSAAKLGRECQHSHSTPYNAAEIAALKGLYNRREKQKAESKGKGKGKKEGKKEKGKGKKEGKGEKSDGKSQGKNKAKAKAGTAPAK